jgi:hypothetical protein
MTLPINLLIVRSKRSNGESSRGAAMAGAAMETTNSSVEILVNSERRTNPPCGSRDRAFFSSLEGALTIGVTGETKSLPEIL